MRTDGYIARNKNGELKLFRTIPDKHSESEAIDSYGDGCMDYIYHPSYRWYAGGGDWGITIPMAWFPEITWDSKPKRVVIDVEIND